MLNSLNISYELQMKDYGELFDYHIFVYLNPPSDTPAN